MCAAAAACCTPLSHMASSPHPPTHPHLILLAGDDSKSLHDPAMSTPQAQAIELMCRCDEIPDEGVELQILKGILTAATSGTFTIHGQVGGGGAMGLGVRSSRLEDRPGICLAKFVASLSVLFSLNLPPSPPCRPCCWLCAPATTSTS